MRHSVTPTIYQNIANHLRIPMKFSDLNYEVYVGRYELPNTSRFSLRPYPIFCANWLKGQLGKVRPAARIKAPSQSLGHYGAEKCPRYFFNVVHVLYTQMLSYEPKLNLATNLTDSCA